MLSMDLQTQLISGEFLDIRNEGRWIMKNTALKKAKSELEIKTRELAVVNQEKIELRAKLERFEEQEDRADGVALRDREELQSQVIWLRNLVEKLAIKPEVFAMVGKQERRRDEMHWRFEEQRRKRDERMIASQSKPMSPRDYRF